MHMSEVTLIEKFISASIPSHSEHRWEIRRPPTAVLGVLVTFSLSTDGANATFLIRSAWDDAKVQPFGQKTSWPDTSFVSGALNLHGDGPWILAVQNRMNHSVSVQGKISVGAL